MNDPINRIAVTNLLDRAHQALRTIDAGDASKVVPKKDLDTISDAIEAIENFCRQRSIILTEFSKLNIILDVAGIRFNIPVLGVLDIDNPNNPMNNFPLS